MRKLFYIICLTVGFLCAASSMAYANDVVLEGSVAGGDEDSMAYQIGVRQHFDPFYAGDLFDITPSLGINAHAWVPDHGDTIWGATVPLGLRFRMFTTAGFRPYIAGYLGPTFLSDDHLDHKDLGSNVMIMSRGVVGVNFGDSLQHRIEGQYTNHSTWGIADTDPGYDTWGVSYGYSF
ncbi:MAG: acyloxyacyl hydrolase [Desulfovibrionaceae bacterium]|nr:acyloxyacyl hydrolase [Desulfovibrionaceae bacterium]